MPNSERRPGLWIGGSLIGILVITIFVVPTAIILPNKDGNSSANVTGLDDSVTPSSPPPPIPTIEDSVLIPTPAPNNGQSNPFPIETPSKSTSPSNLPSENLSTHPSNSPSQTPTARPTTGMPTGKPSYLPSQNPTHRSRNFMFLAYYYPWYISGDWSRHEYQDEPLLGKYGTDEPAVAEKHIEMAERAGIDAWAVSYNTGTSLTARHFEAGMLQASNIDKIKFCMLFESLMALPTLNFADGTLALDTVIGAMALMRDKYFDHPSYLKINGRPVVVLYVTREWENFQPYMLDKIKNEVGVDIFFIADEVFLLGFGRDPNTARNGLKEDGTTVFDAYTSYNMYANRVVIDNESATDFMFRESLPIFEPWAEETVFFPNVLPMYHDFRGHKPLVGDAAQFREQLDTFACLPRPSWYDSDYSPEMVFVTSFNEWWEGSQVEPDLEERYGYTFIDELKRFKEEGIQCPTV